MTPRCETHHCGARLTERMTAYGRILWDCAACDRNAKGLCRDCPALLTKPRALRCPSCARIHTRQRGARAKRADYRIGEKRKRMLASKRRSYANPDVRARQLARAKAWRKANPVQRTDADRLYFRTWAREHRAKVALEKHHRRAGKLSVDAAIREC